MVSVVSVLSSVLSSVVSVVARVVLRGVGGGSCCPPWCRWWLVLSSVVSVVSVLSSVVSSVVSVAYMQPSTHAGTRKAHQCGGGLACESKLQGKFAGCDCSNYQLFRCSSRESFYRLVDKLKH